MAKTKQLRLGAFMRPVSIHTAAWRYPGGTPDANFNLKALVSYAQTLERGRFDAFFMADHLAVLNMPMEALKRSATVTSFDPLTLRGRLNIARPIQGWPVMVQAGASDAGRQLAAETAEVVFAAGGPIEAGRAFYADVKGRAARLGRNPDHIKILPGAFTIIGDSLDEAREKRARLDSLVSYDSGIAALSIAVGVDARKFDPDGPLPEIPETNQSKSGRERVVALARREGLTVRQLAGRLGGYGGLAMMGTPKMIADQMEEWLTTEASDGFNVMFPYLPGA